MRSKIVVNQKITDVKTGEVFYIGKIMKNREIFEIVHESNGQIRVVSLDEVKLGYYKLG